MSNFIEYYEYAKLASAAYANLNDLSGDKNVVGGKIAAAVRDAKKLPEALADQK